MSQKEQIEKQFEELLTPVCEKHGVEVYDVEYVKEGSDYYLRAYIDKEGGVTIGDCEVVNRELSDLMDEKDFIKDAYILEVSSPGLTRPLKRKNDFVKSIGRAVDIKLYKKSGDHPELKTNILEGAILEEYMEDSIAVSYEGSNYSFKLKDISSIKLSFTDN